MEEEKIVQAVRTRRDASINVAMSLMRKGRVDAVVSAGNTGAVMATAVVSRPSPKIIKRDFMAVPSLIEKLTMGH